MLRHTSYIHWTLIAYNVNHMCVMIQSVRGRDWIPAYLGRQHPTNEGCSCRYTLRGVSQWLFSSCSVTGRSLYPHNDTLLSSRPTRRMMLSNCERTKEVAEPRDYHKTQANPCETIIKLLRYGHFLPSSYNGSKTTSPQQQMLLPDKFGVWLNIEGVHDGGFVRKLLLGGCLTP